MSVYARIEDLYSKISKLNSAAGILHWDYSTIMPSGSSKYRAEDLSVLDEISRKMLCSSRLGELLDSVNESKCDKWGKANLKIIKKYRETALSEDHSLADQITKLSMECKEKWVVARKNNDFASVAPTLSALLSLVREQAKNRAATLNCGVYEALLDQYDPGRKEKDVAKIADSLKEFLPGFIKKVVAKQKTWKTNIFDNANFPEDKQKELGLFCMRSIGFDFTRGRLDSSVHPFCGGGTQDVRITTRYNTNEFLSSLMGIMHETGHALYEQQRPIKYCRQAVGGNLGMSIHESQSLFVEVQVSRSKEFLEFILPKAKEIFGFSKDSYSVDSLYKVLNKVNPSFIRVDADEVTYPMHVILRFELERALINGDLSVKDIPGEWNDKMKKYLGVTPDTDSNGCMQDIHWYSGGFGYFPTYMLGGMLSSQFFESMTKDIPNAKSDIKVGKFQSIIKWLRQSIHSHGALYTPDEMVKKVTGRPIDVEGYKKYLEKKFL